MNIKKYRKDFEYSYSLGITLTFELLFHKARYVKMIYIHPNLKKDDTYNKLINLCNINKIYYEENSKIFNILSDKENCFVIGVFNKFYSNIEINSNHVTLVNPSDAGNLGTIIRSSLGFGVKNIAIISPAVDIFNPKVIRSSMGAIFSINFQYYSSFNDYYQDNLIHDFYPLMLKAKMPLNKVVKSEKNFSLIFGNEATGLNDDFLDIGNPIVISHSKDIDSLNLPIAVSIALYEFTKANKF